MTKAAITLEMSNGKLATNKKKTKKRKKQKKTPKTNKQKKRKTKVNQTDVM